MKKTIFNALIIAIFIVGCAGTPNSLSMKGQYLSKIEEEGAKIFINRNTGFGGSVGTLIISMDDVNYFKLNEQDINYLEPEEGERNVCVITPSMFGNGAGAKNCIKVEIKKNQKKFFVLNWDYSSIRTRAKFIPLTQQDFLKN